MKIEGCFGPSLSSNYYFVVYIGHSVKIFCGMHALGGSTFLVYYSLLYFVKEISGKYIWHDSNARFIMPCKPFEVALHFFLSSCGSILIFET